MDESRRKSKQNIGKDNDFHNRSMKSWLKDNATEMYSTHNYGKSVTAEKFIKTIKSKIYFSVEKRVYW